MGYFHHTPGFLLNSPFSSSWPFLQNIWTHKCPSLRCCCIEGEVGMCVLLWEEVGTIPGNSMSLDSGSSAVLALCCCASLFCLSAVGFRAAGLSSSTFRAVFIPHPSGTSVRFLTISREGEFVVQVQEVSGSGMRSCGLIRMYQIISMPCAEQLGWILWRGRAWKGTWSGTSLGSASPPLSLPLASGRLSQPVLS